mgnify:FL=1|jgi:hypothetical protein
MAIEIDVETEQDKKETGGVSFKMNARRSIDGNIMIFDHIDIDIVYSPATKKVVTFAKDLLSDTVYATQNRMFEYLTKKGVVTHDSVRGGNVYGSIEGQIPEPAGDIDTTQVVLMSIGKFIEEEKPYFMYEKAYREMEVEELTDPPADETTPLGRVPQAAKKGSIGKLRGYWNV